MVEEPAWQKNPFAGYVPFENGATTDPTSTHNIRTQKWAILLLVARLDKATTYGIKKSLWENAFLLYGWRRNMPIKEMTDIRK
jgi:hypothetical protein